MRSCPFLTLSSDKIDIKKPHKKNIEMPNEDTYTIDVLTINILKKMYSRHQIHVKELK